MQNVTLSSTNVSCYIRIIDSADFTPEEGVTSATAGLALWYKKGATGAEVGLTESDLANDEAAHSDGGIAHVNDGLYRIDLPDAAVPTVENEVTVVGGTATDMIVLGTALVGVQPIGAPAGASIAADIAAIEAQTDDIGAAGAGLTALGDARLANLDAAVTSRSSHSAADVWSAGTRTLTSYGTLVADTTTAVWAAATRTVTGLTTAALALFATTDTGETEAASGSVAYLAQGDASELTADSIADAVWDEALSGHTTAGTAGDALGDVEADVWSYSTRTLTQAAASVSAAVTGENIVVYRGTRWEITLTGLSDFSDYAKVYFTVKRDYSDADASSIVHIQESTAGTGDGLVYINGAAASDPTDGSITVNSGTSITVYLEADAADDLSPTESLVYGIKWIDTDGHAHLASIGGLLAIRADIPKAVT